jgi:hypothetical protein
MTGPPALPVLTTDKYPPMSTGALLHAGRP